MRSSFATTSRRRIPCNLCGVCITDAQITLKGRHATLGKSSKAREAEIVSPEDAVFDTVSTTPSHEGAKSEYRHSKACRAPRKQGDQRAH
jgi:hypothetical protein